MKIRSLLLLITFAGLLISTPAEAASWEVVSSTSELTKYVDTSSFSSGPKGSQEVWAKTVYKTPECTSDYAKRMNKCVGENLIFERYYKNKTVCQLQIVHNFSDKTERSEVFPCHAERIVPGSAGEVIWMRLFPLQ